MKHSVKILSCLLAVLMMAAFLPIMVTAAEVQDPETLPLGAVASSTYGGIYVADAAFDGSDATRWNSAPGSGRGAWVAYNFGKLVTFDKLTLLEATDASGLPGDFIRAYHIDVYDGVKKAFTTVYTSTPLEEGETKALGENNLVTIPLDAAQTTRIVRIVFDDVGAKNDCCSFTECKLYNGDSEVLTDIPVNNTEKLIPHIAPGASASSVYTGAAGYEADKAYDMDLSTRWNARTQTGNASWFCVDFGEKVDVTKLVINEPDGLYRVNVFTVQFWDDTTGAWTDIATVSDGIGAEKTVDFGNTVTSRYFCVRFSEITSDCVTISEIAYYNGENEVRPNLGYTASSEYTGAYDAAAAFDGSTATRWSAADGQRNGSWIAAEFSSPVAIDTVKAVELYNRVSSYTIQYKDTDGTWKDIVTGDTMGESFEKSFDTVTVSEVRILINTANGEPSFSEITFFKGVEQVLPIGCEITPYDNLALTSDLFYDADLKANGWGWKLANNGIIETAGGYTSLGSNAVANDRVIGYDLGARRLIDEVVLWSSYGTDPAWSGIPKSFVLEVSTNGTAWHAIKEVTNVPTGTQDELSLTFDPIFARYVRIRSTELYHKVDGDYIQIAEMAVYYKRAQQLLCDNTVSGYIQTRPASEGHHDMRVILVGDLEKLSAYSALDVTVTFTTADGTKILKQTLGGNKSDYGLYKVVSADGAYYIAEDGNAMFGNIIAEIPNGAYTAVTVTVTSGETVVYTASAPAA